MLDPFAQFYDGKGRFKSSFDLELVVNKTQMDRLDKEHPDTMTTMNNLATVLKGRGKLGEAEQILVLAVSIR
jgi:Tetratricopeptide repeat